MPPFSVEDDDLALFNEVQNKEIDSFLLQSKIDFDDILPTKLISVSIQGESSDLLAAEGDKNDYNWLISPPETPLFCSLDDEAPPQDNPMRSRPIPILQSPSTVILKNKHSSSFQLRRNPFSITNSSPPSPSKASQGNYASLKKIKTRESNSIHGFSSEASPNLCRSNRPVSGNGTSSMSPTTFRSVDSVASSVDNDLDSLLSSPISQSVPRGVGVYSTSSHVSFYRKPAKSLSRSAPKRSFDLVRQMDRKGLQHMFRPLISSVPSSTFHAGDACSRNHSPTLMDSSVTTSSSYASSDLTSGNHNLNEDNENTISEQSEQYTVDKVMDMMAMCSKCGQVLCSEEVVTKGDPKYCLECKDSDMNTGVTTSVGISNQLVSKRESMNVSKIQHFNGVKEHIVENGSYTASSISYDDFSYVSNTTASMSSSIDLGVSIRQMGQKFSSTKSDMENYRYETPNMHKGSALSAATSFTERDFEEKTCSIPCEQLLASESIEAESTCANIETSIVLLETRANVETLHAQSETFFIEEDNGPPSSCADRVDISEVLHTNLLDAITEDADVISSYSHSDIDSTESKCCMDENEMHHDEEYITKSVEEFDASRTECQVLEESRILLADTAENEKAKFRSLALEEAMDAILFCSSILHSLAYEAANTAINNETFSMEVLRPTSPFLGKPDSERMDSMSLGTMRKRGSKTQKAQQKMLEMDTEPLPCNDETEENRKGPYVGVPNDGDSLKPPKLESKCGCVIM